MTGTIHKIRKYLTCPRPIVSCIIKASCFAKHIKWQKRREAVYLLNKCTVKAWSKLNDKNQTVEHILRKSDYVSDNVQIGKSRWMPNKKNSYRQRLVPLVCK